MVRDWKLLLIHSFLFSFGFAIYNGVFQNYFFDIIRGDELGLGKLEAFRETPGLLCAVMTGTLVALAESRIAGIGLVICGIGIGFSGYVESYWFLVLASVVWSIGFHLWTTMQPAIALNLERENKSGHRLGRLRTAGSAATILALAVAYLVAKSGQQVPYNAFYAAAGITIFAAGICCFFISANATTKNRQPLVIRKEYSLYYWLIFLEGCRRQIFSIFATFVLIKVYHSPREIILGLMFANSAITALVAPAMGRMIDRVGVKKPLMLYAVAICLIFIGYATIRSREVLFALYILDNVMFTFSIGFSVYLHQIVRPGDLTPSLAMGTTMNHIAAVTLPVIGAIAWKQTGNYQVPFWVGAGIAVLALLGTQKLKDIPKSELSHAT